MGMGRKAVWWCWESCTLCSLSLFLLCYLVLCQLSSGLPWGGPKSAGEDIFLHFFPWKSDLQTEPSLGGSAFRRDRFDYKSLVLMPSSQGLSSCVPT